MTLGVGRPDKNVNLKTETMGYGIVENYSATNKDMVIQICSYRYYNYYRWIKEFHRTAYLKMFATSIF